MINKIDIERLMADARELCRKLNPLKKESKKSHFLVKRIEYVIMTGNDRHAEIMAALKYLHNIDKGYVLFTGPEAIKLCGWTCSVKAAENRLTAFTDANWAQRIRTPAGYVYMLNAEKYLKGLEIIHDEMFFCAQEETSLPAVETSLVTKKPTIQNKEANEFNKNNNSAAAFSSNDSQDPADIPQGNTKPFDDDLVEKVRQLIPSLKVKNITSLISKYGHELVEKQANLWTDREARYQESGKSYDARRLFTASVQFDYEPAKSSANLPSAAPTAPFSRPSEPAPGTQESQALEILKALKVGVQIVISGIQYTFEGLRQARGVDHDEIWYSGFNVGLNGQIVPVPITRILAAQIV